MNAEPGEDIIYDTSAENLNPQSRPCEMRWGTIVRCAHPNSYIRQPSSVGREPVIPVRSQLSHGCAKDVHGVMGTRSRVALERAPWTLCKSLVQEWGERVTCLVVTRSKLNGLVGLLYEHYGRSCCC